MKNADIAPFFATLKAANPQPQTELEFTNVFELLAAVLLSAQATDVGVNKATRRLFPIAGTPHKMRALGLPALTEHLKTLGLFRNKAKNLFETCRLLIKRHGGEVPRSREALEALPGVGRKTANVVLNVAFGRHAHLSPGQPHRAGTGQESAASGAEAARARARRVPGGCAPLADPARALYVHGTQPEVRPVRGGRLLRLQKRLAATLIVSAKMAALKANDITDCSNTRRRIGRLVTITSAVWQATAMVNEKYRKSA
jgi:endonuclease-3